jgi:bacterioferritin-associated ferredoxin
VKKRNGLKYMRVPVLVGIVLLALIITYCSNPDGAITPVEGEGGVSAYGTCVACHTSDLKIEFNADAIPAPAIYTGNGMEGPLKDFDAEEIFTVSTDFLTDEHNYYGCKNCHGGGLGVGLKDTLHEGYRPDPSALDEIFCAECHSEIVEYHADSIHANRQAYENTMKLRAGVSELTEEMGGMLDENCYGCHTTCGQCHVSQPDTVNGGLTNGHTFNKIPDQDRNCTACHGVVGVEFRGDIVGYLEDVHLTEDMTCIDCHPQDIIHGPMSGASSRYEVALRPECTDCHADPETYNSQMERHVDNLACNVCHSQEYKNCYQCHVPGPESTVMGGTKFPYEMDLKIGRNPIKSSKTPWDIVLLRHIPISPDTFGDFDFQLDGYTSLPTWKYTSPHNIQRYTPQNASCGSCMNDANLFLTEFYIEMRISQAVAYPQEIEANADVIMFELP